jgi:hypothetical protein
MGCKASRSELQLCKDIANVVASLPATTRPILWDDELSVIAHTVLNTLRNAHYHRKSGRRGSGCGGLRNAASKFRCSGSRPSAAVVSFDAQVIDIDSCLNIPAKGLRGALAASRTLTALHLRHCGITAAGAALLAEDLGKSVSSLRKPVCDKGHRDEVLRTVSYSSSGCSIADTVPQQPSVVHLEALAGSDMDICNAGCHFDSASVRSAPCKTPPDLGDERDLGDELWDLCDILTNGGRSLTPGVC